MRWVHPKRGLISADVIVPAAERSKTYIAQLTELTLEEAISNCGRWRESGRGLGVAVNLSPLVFDQMDLPERIEAIALKHNVLPSLVTLEVTETQIAEDAVKMLDIATRLRIKGFNLSVDDFGTGHSGLQLLQRLPFNELKIDRSFIHGCSESSSKRSVVEASLALAHSLRMTSVAEGIAQRPDWNLLLDLGCDLMQGYFIARPMSEDGFDVWVMKWMMHGG